MSNSSNNNSLKQYEVLYFHFENLYGVTHEDVAFYFIAILKRRIGILHSEMLNNAQFQFVSPAARL